MLWQSLPRTYLNYFIRYSALHKLFYWFIDWLIDWLCTSVGVVGVVEEKELILNTCCYFVYFQAIWWCSSPGYILREPFISCCYWREEKTFALQPTPTLAKKGHLRSLLPKWVLNIPATTLDQWCHSRWKDGGGFIWWTNQKENFMSPICLIMPLVSKGPCNFIFGKKRAFEVPLPKWLSA